MKSKNAQLQGALSQPILPNEGMNKSMEDVNNEDDKKSEGGVPDEDAPKGVSASKSDLGSANSDRMRALSEMRKNPPVDYVEANAIELKRIKSSCFKNSFFESMQQCNYSKFIEAEKFKRAVFVGDPETDNLKPK